MYIFKVVHLMTILLFSSYIMIKQDSLIVFYTIQYSTMFDLYKINNHIPLNIRLMLHNTEVLNAVKSTVLKLSHKTHIKMKIYSSNLIHIKYLNV